MDDKLIQGLIDHIEKNKPLPKGITVKSIIDFQKDISESFKKKKMKCIFKESINDIYPVTHLAIISDLDYKGIISVPTITVFFEFKGEIQFIELNTLWTIVDNVDLALEIKNEVDERISKELKKYTPTP